MSSYIGPRSADVPVGTIATKGTVSANALVIGTNNATIGSALYVDSNGRLLVGTTGPYGSSAEKLTVNGMVTFVGNASSTGNAPFYVYNTDHTASNNQPFIYFHDGSAIRGQIGCNYTDGAMWFNGAFGTYFRNNSGEIGRFNSSGNFGIGSTNPLSKLVVSDAGSYGIEFQPNDTNRAFIITYNRSGAAYYPLHFTSSTYNFRDTSGGYSMVIDGSGNMGIGTASPSFKFDVRGGRAQFSPSSEAFAIGLRYNDSTNGVWLGSPAARPICKG